MALHFDPVLWDLPDRIQSPRFVLRPPRQGDGSAVHAAIMDGYTETRKWLAWSEVPPSVEQIERDCRAQQAAWIMRTDMRWLCFDQQTGEVLGRFAFPAHQCIWQVPCVAISYFVRQSARKKGVATEVVNALTRYAFEHLMARRVIIYTDALNTASIRVPQKLGFIEESRNKGLWPSAAADGALAELIIHGCFDPESLPPL